MDRWFVGWMHGWMGYGVDDWLCRRMVGWLHGWVDGLLDRLWGGMVVAEMDNDGSLTIFIQPPSNKKT